MGEFYESQLGISDLSWFERKSLFSTWHIFTSFSDSLLIIGTLLKILLEYEVMDTYFWISHFNNGIKT